MENLLAGIDTRFNKVWGLGFGVWGLGFGFRFFEA